MAREYLFPVSLGFLDGVITPLMISSHLMLSGQALSITLALRISLGSASVGAFSFFIAEFASNREELQRISRHLNPSSPWKILKGRLSDVAFIDTVSGTLESAGSSFLGSLVPLLSYSLSGSSSILALTLSEVAMALLGVVIARTLKTGWIVWVTGMMIFGILIIVLGFFVQIVS